MKTSINLLPAEYRRENLKQQRFNKIQSIGIFALLTLIFLSSTTFALSLLQNTNIINADNQLKVAEDNVTKYKPKEASLVILKDRLNTLDSLLKAPSKQRSIYNLVTSLLPPSLVPSLIVTDTSGNISLTLSTTDSISLDNFITILTDPETNENKIAKVQIDSLSRGKDGVYRASLKMIGN